MSPLTVQSERTQQEADRLYQIFQKKMPEMTKEVCLYYAPWVAGINDLKKQKNAVILAHSYIQPLVLFGVADFVGDSLFLSEKAMETTADIIVFAGVRFMAETAKILNPAKTVLLPSLEAGCSLAESITAADVRILKQKHPDAWVVTYVNTSAEVKAESDVCCTSSNALEVIEGVPVQEIIFIPDRFMAENLRARTNKTLYSWEGTCVVHEKFTKEQVEGVKRNMPDVKVLVHPESPSEVTAMADYVGSTEGMMAYAKQSVSKQFMFVTECGLSERAKVELPDKEFYGSCILCPYMKKNDLQVIYDVLNKPQPDQIIDVSEDIRDRAKRAVENMFKYTRKAKVLAGK